MEACLRTSRVPAHTVKEFYDSRYFYAEKDIGHITCGVAAETMMLLLQDHRSRDLNNAI
jgi:hypothetical protein